jgi:uncharacterized membrane protein
MTSFRDAQTGSSALRMPRIAVLDAARGIALLAMAIYHFVWDLELFGFLDPGTATIGGFKVFARSIATSFLFLAGLSLVLAVAGGIRWQPFLRRLAMVGGAAAVISIATFFATPGEWIYFGILHHIAALSVLGLLFVRVPWLVTLGCALFAFMLPKTGLVLEAPLLAFLGLDPTPIPSNDFVPLFPWLAAGLSGVALGRLAMDRGWPHRLGAIPAGTRSARFLGFLGRHSLVFYLVHQPVLIALIWLSAQLIRQLSV